MGKISLFTFLAFLVIGCNSKIKNSDAKVQIEKGTEILGKNIVVEREELAVEVEEKETNDTLGFWVGYFEEDSKGKYTGKGISVDEGFYWNRENKINISIDKIKEGVVIGHSVVAGNNRPFKGTVKDGIFQVKEPGDDKYDGEFNFEISDNKLVGKWEAYNDIDIKNRKYALEKKTFSYNPDIMLERSKNYIDWNKFKEEKEKIEFDDNEFEEWIKTEYVSATDLIYSINASNTLLAKKDVENLKKGDITIIRNTIYARHGYSFKNRPLRVFFDAQSWYIPVHTDIKSDFTDIEKENIQLLLRYEKNAAEYYDYFGRG